MQHRAPLTEFDDADWYRLLDTNLEQRVPGRPRGSEADDAARPRQDHQHLLCAKRGGPRWDRRVLGHQGRAEDADQGHGDDLAGHGIQVNGLGPGYFETELTEALVADEQFSAWVRRRTPRPLGRCEGPGGAAVVPGQPGRGLRQRPHLVRRRRHAVSPVRRRNTRLRCLRRGRPAGSGLPPDGGSPPSSSRPGARLNRPRRLARASLTLTQRNQRRHRGDSGSPIIFS